MELFIFILGIITAIVGYGIQQFILMPVQNYRQLRAVIGHKLSYYSHIITSPGASEKLHDEAYPIIRDLACNLESVYLLIPIKRVFIELTLIPDKESILEVKRKMMFISNSLGKHGKPGENLQALKTVFTALNIQELESLLNEGQDARLSTSKVQ